MNYFNYTSKTLIRQINFPPTLQPVKEFRDNPSLFLKSLSRSHLKVMDILIRFSQWYKTIYPAQETIAHEVGLSRVHVNRIIGELVAYGFIAKKRRYNSTSYYKVSPYFTFADVRQKLSKFFKSLYALPIALLLSFTPDVTLTNIKDTRKSIFYKSHPQKRRVMRNERQVIPAHIARLCLPGVQLTRAQKLKLCAFNQKTIDEGMEKFRRAKDIRNPYNYFFKLCLDYADIHDEPIDFAYVSHMEQRLPDSTLNDFPSMQKKTQQGENSKRINEPPRYKVWKEHSPRRRIITNAVLDDHATKWAASFSWNVDVLKKEQEMSNDQEVCGSRGTVFNNQTSHRGASGVG